MTDFNEKDLEFVARRYRAGQYDTRKAIRKFHEKTAVPAYRRWWMTAAAAAASVVLVVAAGYGIHNWVKRSAAPVQVERPALNPYVAETHTFVYEDAPLADVLAELSAYYHCTLSAPDTDKRLTATFPDDDVDFIVGLIEQALDIDITVVR